ncbi:CASP2 [Bugula neritina]|uniref:CASP2 n=1 Tax=Bugula neritina TaxID=10212 RepID=A0A7J7JTI7_BUGNE|nr:CASP2 [Bugula neritina]
MAEFYWLCSLVIRSEHNLAQYSHESDNESDLSDHEDFYLPGEEHHIKMEVSVTRREDIKQLFYSNQVYRMSETVRGRALIINTNVFPNRPDLFRKGSAVDVSNIEQLDVRHDRTAEEMLKDIKEETQRPDHEDYGMHITVLMSHGATYGAYGMLYGADLKPVKLLDVFDLLSSDNFKHMAGKPKVVIVVADRNESSEGQESHYRSQQTKSESKNYNIEDMLILQSCFDGQNSIRDANYGSPFIRELVKTLYKHSSHTDLATLFDIVQERVKKVTKKLAEKHSHAAQQVPVVTLD